MILHKVLRRGSDHADFCQDAIAIGEVEKIIFFCVFDGCSGGKDSHFASALFSKAFNDIILNFSETLNTNDRSLEMKTKLVIYMMLRKIQEVKHVLHIGIDELLSTIVICGINKETKECIICAFGDGYFSVDGKGVMIENKRFIDQTNGDNKPDYMAYDLHTINSYTEFENWFSQKSEIHKFENIKDVSIASDGIGTFRQFKDTINSIDVIDYLVNEESFLDTKNMLERKYNLLKSKYNMINQDDLSLVRVKFEDAV